MAVSNDMIGSVIIAQYFGEQDWTSDAERSRVEEHGSVGYDLRSKGRTVGVHEESRALVGQGNTVIGREKLDPSSEERVMRETVCHARQN